MTPQVLLVDDDPMLLKSLKRCLQDRYRIETAESGEKALHHLKTNDKTPVVISDMRMPGMDGAEFIGEAVQIAPHTRYLMLTGTPSDAHLVRQRHGDLVSRFLAKPCERAKIAQAIDDALEAYASDPATSEQSNASAS